MPKTDQGQDMDAWETLTGMQVRMARAGLRWSIADLAKRANVGISTVRAIEAVDGRPGIAAGLDATRDYREGERVAVLERIANAFAKAGMDLPADGSARPNVGADDKAHAPAKVPKGRHSSAE